MGNESVPILQCCVLAGRNAETLALWPGARGKEVGRRPNTVLAMWIACILSLAMGFGWASSPQDLSDDLSKLGDASQAQCEALVRAVQSSENVRSDAQRCLRLMHRLGRLQVRKQAWRGEYLSAVSRLTWGMPGCPVELKMAAGGRAMACNNTAEALRAFEQRPLLMHIVNDGMSWLHFETRAVLECPYKCLWSGAVEPPHVADVHVYDCLQQPTMPPGLSPSLHTSTTCMLCPACSRYGLAGCRAIICLCTVLSHSSATTESSQQQIRMLVCMESAAHLPRLEQEAFLRRFHITATYKRNSDVPLLYAPGNLSLYAYGAPYSDLQYKVWRTIFAHPRPWLGSPAQGLGVGCRAWGLGSRVSRVCELVLVRCVCGLYVGVTGEVVTIDSDI